MKQRPFQSHVRRIYVCETIYVQNDTQVNVPLRMPLVNWHSPCCGWLTQAKEIKPGIFRARTLLPNSDLHTAVRFINISGSTHTFHRGLCLGDAEPGIGPKLDTVAPPSPEKANATLRTKYEHIRPDGMVRDDHRDGAAEPTPHLGFKGVGSLEPDSTMARDSRGSLERASDRETDTTKHQCGGNRMFRPWERTDYEIGCTPHMTIQAQGDLDVGIRQATRVRIAVPPSAINTTHFNSVSSSD